MKKLQLLVLSFLLICGFPAISFGGTVKQDVIAPYVEIKLDNKSFGSGFVVKVPGKEKLHVLTAYHVIEWSLNGAEPGYGFIPGHKPEISIYKKLSKGVEITYICKVVKFSVFDEDGGNDLALLEPEDDKFLVPCNLSFEETAQAEEGDECWYCGNQSGLHAHLEKSIVSNVDYIEKNIGNLDFGGAKNHPYLIANGSAWHGDSGGGLYIKRGDKYYLAGVIVRKASRGNPKTPVLCQQLSAIKKLLED